MIAFLSGLEKAGEDMQNDLVISQRAFLIAIRTYFDIRMDKTLQGHARFLVSEGMFELHNGDFLVTEKAKRIYGYGAKSEGLTIKPDEVNKIG